MNFYNDVDKIHVLSRTQLYENVRESVYATIASYIVLCHRFAHSVPDSKLSHKNYVGDSGVLLAF